MNIFSDITKSTLEFLIKNIFLKFGNISTSKLIDSIKILGFFYATAGGISISLEDLKNSLGTEDILSFVKSESSLKTLAWEEGKISDLERFEIILNSWNLATEYIKNEIISYYKKFDPLNCLYLMSNSGARGNMSQVRQLIGLRGLMSDQQGNVIDVPIHASFSKGLTNIDYIISAYGARKGIVDTAIKTANAGYLTRRLIFLMQNIVIRSVDCNTKNGLTLNFNKQFDENNILGHYVISIKDKYNKDIDLFSKIENNLITKNLMTEFKSYKDELYIKIRTISNCKNQDSICQKCYGYDLAFYENVQLGEVIGIIAAQSIGEPGTQLTMRTFHTGGVFTTQIASKSKISLSAKAFIPKSLKRKKIRIEYNLYLNKLSMPISILLMEWFGKKSKMELRNNYYLPFDTSKICYKNDYIGEQILKKSLILRKKLKPFIIKYDTEVYNKKLFLIPIPTNLMQYIKTMLIPYNQLTLSNQKRIISLTKGSRKKCYINAKNGYLSLKIGKILSIKKNFESFFEFCEPYINKYKTIAKAKLVSMISGIVNIINNNIIIITSNCRYSLNILELLQIISSSNQKIYLFTSLQKYQYIDKYSNILDLLLIPFFSERVYKTQKYIKNDQINIFISGNSTAWNTFFDINKKILNKIKIINYEKSYNQLLYSINKGIFLKQNGSNHYFQNFLKFFIEQGNILNILPKNIIASNTIIGKSLTSPIQGNDIVQGLPKVEQIISATCPKLKQKAILSNFSGQIESEISSGNKLAESNNIINNNIYTHSLEIKKDANILKKSFWIKHFPIGKNILISKNQLWEYQNANNILINNWNALFYKFYKKSLISTIEDTLFNIYGLKFSYPEILELYESKILNVHDLRKIRIKILKLIKKKIYKLIKKRVRIYSKFAQILNNIDEKIKIKILILKLGRNNFFLQHPNFPENISIITNKLSKKKLYTYLFENIYNPIFLKKETKSQALFSQKIIPYILKDFVKNYKIPKRLGLLFKLNNYVNIAEPLSKGYIDPHKLLSIFYNYYFLYYNNVNIALSKSVNKFRLILLNSLISVYEPQGVKIALKHIELVSRQLTNKALVNEFTYSKFIYIKNENILLINPFLPNEEINLSAAMSIYNKYKDLKQKLFNIQLPIYTPIFKSSINVAITRPGFLSSASFQHTKRVLLKASLIGTTEWITGLKEKVITGKFIPGGTTYQNINSIDLNKNQFYKNI